jgi:hypothetical protein
MRVFVNQAMSALWLFVLAVAIVPVSAYVPTREYFFSDVCDRDAKTCVVGVGNVYGSNWQMTLPQTFLNPLSPGNPIDSSGWTLLLDLCADACDPTNGTECRRARYNQTKADYCASGDTVGWSVPYLDVAYSGLTIRPRTRIDAADVTGTYAQFVSNSTTLDANQPVRGEVPKLCTVFVFRGRAIRVEGLRFSMAECAALVPAAADTGHAVSLTPILFETTDASDSVVANVTVADGGVTAVRFVPPLGAASVNMRGVQLGPGLVVAGPSTAFGSGASVLTTAVAVNFYGPVVYDAAQTGYLVGLPVTTAVSAVRALDNTTALTAANWVNVTEILGASAARVVAAAECTDGSGGSETCSNTTLSIALLVLAGLLLAGLAVVAGVAIRHACKNRKLTESLMPEPEDESDDDAADDGDYSDESADSEDSQGDDGAENIEMTGVTTIATTPAAQPWAPGGDGVAATAAAVRRRVVVTNKSATATV